MMKLYKKMVRPYSLEGAWQGTTSAKTPLADWMDEEEKTKSLEKEMEQKCKEHDRMSTLVWEEKYESVGLFGTFEGQPINDLQRKKIEEILEDDYYLPKPFSRGN